MGTLGEATLTTDVDLKGLDKGFDKGKKKSKSFTDEVSKGFGRALGFGLADAAEEAVGAVIQFTQDSVAEFQQFESGFSEVMTLLPDLTTEATASMEADLRAFGLEAGRLTSETVPALYQSISAGVPQENVFDFMKIASDAALGGVTTLETAVDGITSVVNAYGAENVNAQEASDLLFTAVKGGKTTFEELSRSIFQVTPVASSLGLEFGNVTAGMAALTAQGVPTSVAATRLRQLLVELSKEGTIASEAFEDVAGIGFKAFLEQGGNLQDALVLMEEQATALDTDISNLFSSVEAGGAALALTGKGTDKFTQELRAAEDAAGATAEAAETMQGTALQANKELKAAFQDLQLVIGEELTPDVIELTRATTQLLNIFSDTVGPISDLNSEFMRLNPFTGQLAQTTFDAAQQADSLGHFIAILKQEEDALTTTTLMLDSELESVNSTMALYDSNLLHATSRTEIATTATTTFGETTSTLAFDLETAAGRLAFAAAMADDYTEASVAYEVTAEDVIAAEERRELQTEATAEAVRIAAEEQLALDERLGGYFITALNAGDETQSLADKMFAMGQQAGLSATDLGILAAATGDYTAEQIQAAIEAAVFEENLGQLIAKVKAQELSLEDATEAAEFLRDGVKENVEEAIALAEVYDSDLINSLDDAGGAAVHLAQDVDGVTGSLGAAKAEALEIGDALDSIPRNIDVSINISANNPNIPTQDDFGDVSGGGLPEFAGVAGLGQRGLAGESGFAGLFATSETTTTAFDDLADALDHTTDFIFDLGDSFEDLQNLAANTSRLARIHGDFFDQSIADLERQNLNPLTEEIASIDELLKEIEQSGELTASDFFAQNELLARRNELEQEFAAHQEEILAMQREQEARQERISRLQSQLELLELVEEAGLSFNEVFAGIELGADASAAELAEATEEVLDLLVDQMATGLSQFSGTASFMPEGRSPTAALNLSGNKGDVFIYQDQRQVVSGDDTSLEAFRLLEMARGTAA